MFGLLTPADSHRGSGSVAQKGASVLIRQSKTLDFQQIYSTAQK